jgi:hypothetical protein
MERFSDDYLKKFEMKMGPTGKDKPRWKDGSRAWYLLPYRTTERTRSFEVSPEEWTTALRLSKEGGFYVSDGEPFTSDRVRYLRRAITTAIEKKPVEDSHMKTWLEQFLAFLSADGQYGFTLSKEWRRLSGR